MVALVVWQQRIVDRYPKALLRGVVHTDGWPGLNRVGVKGRDAAYPRSKFPNRPEDIRRRSTDPCDRLEIAWRPWGRSHVSVARRDSVRRMDDLIGPKA